MKRMEIGSKVNWKRRILKNRYKSVIGREEAIPIQYKENSGL